jgi:Holliday junction resolvase
MSPIGSDDLTEVIVRRDTGFVVLRSPASAEHQPDYVPLAEFASRQDAEAYLGQ